MLDLFCPKLLWKLLVFKDEVAEAEQYFPGLLDMILKVGLIKELQPYLWKTLNLRTLSELSTGI